MFDTHLERVPLLSPGIALESQLYCSKTDAERKSKEISGRVMALAIPLLHLVGAFTSFLAIPISLLALIPTYGNSLLITFHAPCNIVNNLACCVLSFLEIPQKLWNGPNHPPAYFNTHYRYKRYESYQYNGVYYDFQITNGGVSLISTTDPSVDRRDPTLYSRIARA